MMSQVKLCPFLPGKPLPPNTSMGPSLSTQLSATGEEAPLWGGTQQGRTTLWT